MKPTKNITEKIRFDRLTATEICMMMEDAQRSINDIMRRRAENTTLSLDREWWEGRFVTRRNH